MYLDRHEGLFTIHPPGDLTSLLVAPADWGEVGFVVHEATVEVRLLVGVGRRNVDLGNACKDRVILETATKLTLPRLAGYSFRRYVEWR